jgi:hypothetical protein
MNRIALIYLTSLLFSSLPSPTHAEDELPRLKPSPPAKFWRSGDASEAEMWLLPGGDGAIRLHGRDAVSSFSGVVVAGESASVWHCTGTGFRFDGGIAFAYQSTYTLEAGADGPVLQEVWTATLPNGEKIEGKTTFKPAALAE